MTEFLEPKQLVNMPYSNNPYIRALQAANRIGLMGVFIEDIDRTFPLGETDFLMAAFDVERIDVEANVTQSEQRTPYTGVWTEAEVNE